MRVLLTGMSGTGKSTLVAELRRRGVLAYDADEDGFSEPRRGPLGLASRRGRRPARAAHRRAAVLRRLLEEQADLPFDYRVLLTAPEAVLIERLRTRTNNP